MLAISIQGAHVTLVDVGKGAERDLRFGGFLYQEGMRRG